MGLFVFDKCLSQICDFGFGVGESNSQPKTAAESRITLANDNLYRHGEISNSICSSRGGSAH